MNIGPDVITFVVLGVAMIAFGRWAWRNIDLLIHDDVTAEPDDDEYWYRDRLLQRGSASLIFFGGGMVVVGVVLAFV